MQFVIVPSPIITYVTFHSEKNDAATTKAWQYKDICGENG